MVWVEGKRDGLVSGIGGGFGEGDLFLAADSGTEVAAGAEADTGADEASGEEPCMFSKRALKEETGFWQDVSRLA